MSVTIDQFDDFFRDAVRRTDGRTNDPFPWQTRLAKQVFSQGWPDCIDLPTASGKTACIDIAIFVLACQADFEANKRTVGRRIFFTVNRRVIVDEAFDRSRELAQKLLDAKEGILKEVADALRSLNENGGDNRTPPLEIAQLRGGIYRDTAWARSLTQPMVVCTTADQLGSRLLFRGYGVSDSMKPIHAALCACDSLVLQDEAHVTKAFSQTMRLLPRYQAQHNTVAPLTFVQMTATPTEDATNRFELNADDQANDVLSARQNVSKPATLTKLDKKKSIVDEIVKQATGAVSETRKAVGIIVNRVQTAREICAELIKGFPQDVHLVIGRMRPIDRDILQKRLRALVGPDRLNILDKPLFVVATQCLEVGADYDFDALITECASVDALRQRFGRLNRRGRKNADETLLDVVAAIVTNDESIKGEDPIYGDAIKHTWEWLQSNKNADGRVDFGIATFKTVWKGVEREHATYLDRDCSKPLLSPAPDAAVLLPAHLDVLCQTAPQPVPSPDVSYFIHGPQRDNAEVNVCWRADLGEDPAQWPEIVRLLPPTSPECMAVPLVAMKKWLGQRFKIAEDADVPTTVPEEVDEKDQSNRRKSARIRVVAWRGSKQCDVVETPRDIHPNDTIVIRTQDFGWEALGHIPGAPTPAELSAATDEAEETKVSPRAEIERRRDSVDQAETATRQSRLRIVVRLHPIFPARAQLSELKVDELRNALRSLIDPEFADDTEERERIKRFLSSPFDRHDYPEGKSREIMLDQVIVFKRLLEPTNKLHLPPIDEEEEDDNHSQLDRFISLSDHTQNVVDRLTKASNLLDLRRLQSTVTESAVLHDLGKADARFQAMLAGITPTEAIMRPTLLGKGDGQRRTQAEKKIIYQRAIYEPAFRHEMLSIQIVENQFDKLVTGKDTNRDLLLHLIGAHHGHARPFAPVVIDEPIDPELLSIAVSGLSIGARTRQSWKAAHQLDSGVAERFWALTRAHGWWGLAWLEAILRVADQQASATEQEGAAK